MLYVIKTVHVPIEFEYHSRPLIETDDLAERRFAAQISQLLECFSRSFFSQNYECAI